LAAYEGPWRVLRDETPLLRERLRELRERETRLDDLLVVALVGGSGVGKSTLLNALAGDQLAATSEFRPCTATPTVYQPPGARFGLDGWTRVRGSALEHLVLIDTPDSDTVVREHRDIVVEALAQCDLILVCGSPEKYLDEATWSLLRPLQGERTMVCVETKADLQAASIREHWMTRLKEQGFTVSEYFRVSPRRTLDRKLTGRRNGEDEFDFNRLESYLRQELTAEQVRRIKRSNAAGLLVKTLSTLGERIAGRRADLEAFLEKLREADKSLAGDVCDSLMRRIFAEPHLWNFALGREIGLRAKGMVWSLYRALEAVRTLPARAMAFFSWSARSPGRQAAEMLSGPAALVEDDLDVATDSLRRLYESKNSEVALAFVRAGFDSRPVEEGLAAFVATVRHRVTAVLRGPARDGVVARARLLTCWPATLVADAPPVAFIGYAGYRIVGDYFAGATLPGDYFLHAGIVLAILLGIELFFLGTIVRLSAWSARRRATRDLRAALLSGKLAFHPERDASENALARVRALSELEPFDAAQMR
jgi:hypothetical protein